ncbi:hypothetical protein FEF22_000610 [Texas Phoenix palm phytoplasma]|uniref:Sequence-variable mosaic (SVM) signal sequence domain-containing protein n=1 Tax=Texas Phoenix palm phytoplasma TaxID=176709 RepID=A0ABS5BI75_9MOLU|nr:SVM family protein [Texas Phoenix palm phytoplasma]MBP3059290.1 hypothetical protein [Texas Phoenix palm phytoplasma]
MFKVKKQFSSIIYICLISFIVLLFIINNDKVMAMNKNNYERINDKGKQISNNESSDDSDAEVNDFFHLFKLLNQLLKKTKKKFNKIKEKNSLFEEASAEDIEAAHILLDIKNSDKKPKKLNLDLNDIPKEN